MKEAVEMLVLPIKALLGHYIYDANRNETLAVSKDLFNYISEAQADKVCPASYKWDHEFQLQQPCGNCSDSPFQSIVYPSNDLGGEEGNRTVRNNKTMEGKSWEAFDHSIRMQQISSFVLLEIAHAARCNCMYCNVLHNSPHETEVGTNSIEAMTRDGYWS